MAAGDDRGGAAGKADPAGTAMKKIPSGKIDLMGFVCFKIMKVIDRKPDIPAARSRSADSRRAVAVLP